MQSSPSISGQTVQSPKEDFYEDYDTAKHIKEKAIYASQQVILGYLGTYKQRAIRETTDQLFEEMSLKVKAAINNV